MGRCAFDVIGVTDQQQAGTSATLQFRPEPIVAARPSNRHMREVRIVKEIQFLEIKLEVAALFPCVMPLITHQFIQLMCGAKPSIKRADVGAEHGSSANVVSVTHAFSEVEQPIFDCVLLQREP